MFSHWFWHTSDYTRHHSSGSKQSENYTEIMSYILRYQKLLSAVGLDMWAIDETVQYWKRNNSVNIHTLNYMKMDYRNLILRRLHRLRGKGELPAAEFREARARWTGCHALGFRHRTPRATGSGIAVGSHPPWLRSSITVITLFKGHAYVLILNVRLIWRDQKMLFPGPEELSDEIFMKDTSLNF